MKEKLKAGVVVREQVLRKTPKVVKAAHYLKEDTGNKQVVQIINGDGEQITEERPIMRKIFVEADVQEIEETQDVWVVETESNGLKERHEFASETDALNYKKGVK